MPVENNEYKQIIEIVKDSENELNQLSSMLKKNVSEAFNLNQDILYAVFTYTNESSIEDIRELFVKYSDSEDSELKYKNMKDDELMDIFNSIKTSSNLIIISEEELKSIKKDAADIANEYINYLSSPKVEESRDKKVAAMKEALVTETDEQIKKVLQEKIDTIENVLNYSFLYRRLDTLGKEEIDNIVRAFFDKKRGTYNMDKCTKKLHLFGFNENIYRYFFNIEEIFLPEEYHDFNNLFLFVYMRFVAFSDPNKKRSIMEVQAITSAMAKLIYHKFNKDDECEEKLISVIKKILDYFEDYRDEFHENNTTRPGHPVRVEADNRHELNRKTMLVQKMEELGITGYDNDWSADQLQKFFNDETDKIIESQRLKNYGDGEHTKIDKNEDGSLSIEPSIDELENSDTED